MVGRIKLFRCVRHFYKTIGIRLPSKQSQKFSFNWRNLFIFSSALIMLILQVAFFFFKAKSIQEYGLSFYGCASLSLLGIDATAIVWQRSNIRKLFTNLDDFIELSKSNTVWTNFSSLMWTAHNFDSFHCNSEMSDGLETRSQ